MKPEGRLQKALSLLKAARGALLRGARDLRDDSAVAAVEFAMVAPLMLLIVLGGLVFGFALANYLVVSNAADVGASNLILSRGAATPYSSTISAINATASTLKTANLTITLTVNGASCASDAACQTALSNAASQQASVSVSYPCTLTVLQINFAPNGCTLKANTVGLIQ